jgi:hypothetical protein
MQPYDIAFVGHMCFDAITPFGGKETVAPGSAVLCASVAQAEVRMPALFSDRLYIGVEQHATIRYRVCRTHVF